MSYKMYGALIASLSIATLLLTANAAAAAGGAPRSAFASARPMAHAPGVFRHHRRHGVAGAFFWPGVGDDFYGPSDYGPSTGAPMVEGAPQASGDVHYTYKYDVPWDWAHRFPPNVTPSDRAYVPSCTAETVTVPGRDGADHSVNVTRCY